MPKVQLKLRSAYGHERIYPANFTANLLLRLTGRKTFQQDEIGLITQLGFPIEWLPAIPKGVSNGQ